jgi:hypothetical protein
MNDLLLIIAFGLKFHKKITPDTETAKYGGFRHI